MPQLVQIDARVPIELVDLIAFHLRPVDLTLAPWGKPQEPGTGLTDLISCSLVCHQWRAIVLGHLYFNITCGFRKESGEGVLDRQAPEGMATSTDGDLGHSYKTLSLLCEFLENTPVVRRCIRQLRLINRSEVPHDRRQHLPVDELDCALFAHLLRLCPRLDVLHLYGVFLCDVQVPDGFERRSLQVLKIEPCHRGSYQQMLRPPYRADAEVAPLMFFSSIRHLHLSTPVHGNWLVPPITAFPPLEVHQLEVEKSGHGLQSLVSALRRSGAVNSIRVLTISMCNRHRTDGVNSDLQELLALVSPTLEQVKVIRVYYDKDCAHPVILRCTVLTSPLTDVPTFPDLSQCHLLRRLYIECNVCLKDITAIVASMLRSVPQDAPLVSLILRVVLLKGDLRVVSEAARAILDVLDEELANVVDVHRTVPEVTVRYFVYSDGNHPPFEPDMRALFKRLNAKGKLCAYSRS